MTMQLYTILLCLYVVDPSTFLSSNNGLGTSFSSENSLFKGIFSVFCFVLFYFIITLLIVLVLKL